MLIDSIHEDYEVNTSEDADSSKNSQFMGGQTPEGSLIDDDQTGDMSHSPEPATARGSYKNVRRSRESGSNDWDDGFHSAYESDIRDVETMDDGICEHNDMYGTDTKILRSLKQT